MLALSGKSKLTLWLDRKSIAVGKALAHKYHKSLSQVVAEYFDRCAHANTEKMPLGPLVRRLSGIIKGKPVSKKEYYKSLEKKYIHG